jgi:hypothetical protein
MYRRGLSRDRIADLVRARTVAYHLAAARTRDPGLEDEHAAAAGNPASATVTHAAVSACTGSSRWSGSEEDRYPSSRSPNLAERTLAAWLGRRCREAADRTLLGDLAALLGYDQSSR